MKYVFSAVYTKEEKGYSVLCPELGVASQGANLKEAEHNIQEAVQLYIEDVPQDELAPLHGEVSIGTFHNILRQAKIDKRDFMEKSGD